MTEEEMTKYKAAAKRRYADSSDDDIEVYDGATVSVGDEGAFVQAWVWVRKGELDD